MSAPPPQLVDALRARYVLERELGQGGMATVYLAHDVRHRRPVAVKVLRPDLAATLGGDRFLQEIESAARASGFRVRGDRFYFNLGDQQSDLWMAEIAGSR